MSSRRPLVRRMVVGALLLLASPFVTYVLIRAGLAVADSALMRRYPPPGQMIAVGPSRLHLFCQGSGAPTVVVEPGLGVDWVSWAPLVTTLAQSNEVCVYDRAGYGWSEAGPMPRTAERGANELHALLAASGRAGPYLLVAHSYGGHIARVFAAAHGTTLRGVVLVDPSEEDPAQMPAVVVKTPPRSSLWTPRGIIDRLPPLGFERVRRLSRGDSGLSAELQALPSGFRHRAVIGSSLDQLAAEQSELESSRLSQIQASAAVFPRDVPLIVISPLNPEAAAHKAAAAALRRDRHRRLASASSVGLQVLATRSGHMVHVDQPDLILSAVQRVLTGAERVAK